MLESRDHDRANESQLAARQPMSRESEVDFARVRALTDDEINREIDAFLRSRNEEPVADGAGI